jgi:hypothetical protein
MQTLNKPAFCTCDAVARQTSVSEARQICENAQERLTNIMAQLTERLASVMHETAPTVPAPPENKLCGPDTCELSNWITQVAMQTDRTCNQIEFIMSRLEI